MKKSVILLPNFHMVSRSCVKFSLKLSLTVKVSMKVLRLLDTYFDISKHH